MADEVEPLIVSGLSFLRADNADAAKDLFEQALAAAPGNAEALHLLGLALDLKGDFSGAIASIKRAIATDASEPLYLLNLAAICGKAGMRVDKADLLAKAATLRPDDIRIIAAAGNAALACGRIDASRGAFERAIAIDPGYSEGHAGLAEAAFAQQNYSAAFAAAEQALRITPANLRALRFGALSAFALRRWPAAEFLS